MNDVLIRLVASLVVILLFCFFFSICIEDKDNENKLLQKSPFIHTSKEGVSFWRNPNFFEQIKKYAILL